MGIRLMEVTPLARGTTRTTVATVGLVFLGRNLLPRILRDIVEICREVDVLGRLKAFAEVDDLVDR